MPILADFGNSRSVTAGVFSTNAAVHQLAGPMGGWCVGKVGARWTVVIGGLLAAAGCLGSSFAPNIYVLFLTHGVINGR